MSQEENTQAAVNYTQEGDQICATRPDFVDLASSPAGFGDTQEAALQALELAEKATQDELEKTAEADREKLKANFENLRRVALTGPQPSSSVQDSDEACTLIERLHEICERNKWPMAAVVGTFIPNEEEGAETPIRLVSSYALTYGTKAARIHSALCDARVAHIHAANMVAFRESGMSSQEEVQENDRKSEDSTQG